MVRKGDDFTFDTVKLRTVQGATLNASGRASIAKGGRLDVTAGWNHLAWPLQGGAPVVVSQTGKGHVTGTLADYQLDVDAQLAGPSIPPGHWVLAGRGNQERMDVRSLRGDVLRGQLAMAGNVAWKPQVAWNVRVNGDGIDPGVQVPDYPGRITFAATSAGNLRGDAIYGRVDLNQLSGNLRGNPVAGQAHLEMAGNDYRLPGLDLRSGTARLTANGTFTKTAGNLDFRLAAPNLAEALANAGGAVTAQGHLSGPWKTPQVIAQASGQSLVYQTYSAETASLKATSTSAANGPMHAQPQGRQRRAQRPEVRHRHPHRPGDAPGPPDHPRRAPGGERRRGGSLDLALAGGLRGTTAWSGEIRRLDLTNRQTGTWRLAGPAGLTAGTTQAALKGFCWTSGDARLCADGQWAKNGPWSGNGTVAAVPFSLLKPFLPPDLQITGAVGGTFAGTGTPDRRRHRQPRPPPRPGRDPLSRQGRADRPGPLRPGDRPHGRRRRRADRPRRPHLRQHRGVLRADLRLPQYNKIGAPLQSQTVARAHRRQLLQPRPGRGLRARPRQHQGHPQRRPDPRRHRRQADRQRRRQLRQAQVDVPKYNLQVRQIELTAKAAGTGPIQIQGSARSGTGT